jgi:hypothetical protein
MREWMRSEMNVAEKYCWAITHAVGRSYSGRSGCSMLQLGFQLHYMNNSPHATFQSTVICSQISVKAFQASWPSLIWPLYGWCKRKQFERCCQRNRTSHKNLKYKMTPVNIIRVTNNRPSWRQRTCLKLTVFQTLIKWSTWEKIKNVKDYSSYSKKKFHTENQKNRL